MPPTSMDERSVSVILPNFNHGRYLERAVTAILAQDRLLNEVCIIDDGSTDDSIAIIERLALRSPLIKVRRNPSNIGLVATQNQALRTVSGRYVYFAAADDWTLPGFFSYAATALQQHPEAGLACGDAVLIDGVTGRRLSVRPIVMPAYGPTYLGPERVRRLLAGSDNWVLTGSALFRTEAVTEAGGLPNELGSFADGFLTRKIALTHGFCYSPRTVSTWCIYPNSYSQRTAKQLDLAQRLLTDVPKKIAADSAFPDWYAQRFAERWRFLVARTALRTYPPQHELLVAMGCRNALDRIALNFATAIPLHFLCQFLALAWLWLRFRPYSLTGLAMTYFIRRLRTLFGAQHPDGRNGTFA